MLETGSNFEWLSNITISQILIPSIIVLFPSVILTHFNGIYSTRQEKTKYLNFLKNNSEPVNDFINKIRRYESHTSAKYIILFYGILVGFLYSYKIVNYIISVSDILVNSYLIKIFPYLILYTMPKYTNITDLKVDFFVFVSSFNNLIIIFLVVIFMYGFYLDYKKYNFPKLTKNMFLTKWSMLIYLSYFFLIGTLIGIDIFILFYTIYSMLKFSPVDQDFSISLTYFSSTLTNLKTQIPTEKYWHIVVSYLCGFYASIGIFYILFLRIIDFPIHFNSLINDFYIPKFPYILLKTESGEVFGQLHDFQNKSILMLNENKVFKAVPWDQIRTIEITNKEEKEEQPIKVFKNEAIHPR